MPFWSKKRKTQETAPPPPAGTETNGNPVPALMQDFLAAVTPKEGPVDEMLRQFNGKAEAQKTPATAAPAITSNDFMLPAGHSGSYEWLVEMRIRVWMQKRQQELREAEKAGEKPNSAPKPPPPAPPKP